MNALMFLIFVVAVAVVVALAIIATKVVEARKYKYGEILEESKLANEQLAIAVRELRLIQRSGGDNALSAELALDEIYNLADNKELTGGNR